MSADGYISFTGGSAEEAEGFIIAIKRRAYSKGKHNDNVWIAEFVSICLENKALRWYESLDEETQKDWRLLKRAMLEEYKDASLPPSIVPTSAPALKISDQGSIPLAAWPPQTRIGRIRVDCDSKSLQGYISNIIYQGDWCTVSQNQSTAATFEFDALARIIKFQGTTDDYLAARLYRGNWEPKETSTDYAAAVRNSGQNVDTKQTFSNEVRVDIWSMADENKLVPRWPLKLGGLLELEPTTSELHPSKVLVFAKNYGLFSAHPGRDGYKPLTLYFETLS